MKTLSMTQMLAGALVLTVVLMLGTPRQAQASDTGKLIAAAVVGAIVYEALDDDNDNCHKAKHRRTVVRYERPRAYRGAPVRVGWNTPLPGRCDVPRYQPPHRENRYEVLFRDNDHGSRGRGRYGAPGQQAKLKYRHNQGGTQMSFRYHDSDLW